MRTIFVISDTHFGHENILGFKLQDGSAVRTFHDVHHMDEMMVENWNKVVGDSDIVYHLGDVYFGKGHEVLPRLKGKKRLIVGNHDNPKSDHILKHFQKVMLWREFADFNCVMTHVPVHESALYKRKYNLHGHVHNGSHRGLIEDDRYINCCVEVNDYRPRAIEDIMKGKI
jgi:calcineurin-like phosphoesterase family protein